MSSTGIAALLQDSSNLKARLAKDEKFLSLVYAACSKLKQTASSGGLIMACGNGGSACDAMHLTEELVARYKRERPGIRAIHFQDSGTLSCWSNDYEFAGVFERQVETFATPNDCLVAISTSGNSANVLRAVEAAKRKGCFSIGLLGKSGGTIAPLCDLSIVVPAQETERIQEVHITLIHIFCEALESDLLERK